MVEKEWPMSEGDGKATRKKKPRILAITTDCCTGCAGSPACIEYCPIEACMFWITDEDHPPFGRIEVDPYLCIGCQKCTSKGPDGAFLASDTEIGIDIDAAERRVILVRDPEHAGFD